MKDISQMQQQWRVLIAALALPVLIELTGAARPNRGVTQMAVAWADALLEELGGE